MVTLVLCTKTFAVLGYNLFIRVSTSSSVEKTRKPLYSTLNGSNVQAFLLQHLQCSLGYEESKMIPQPHLSSLEVAVVLLIRIR